MFAVMTLQIPVMGGHRGGKLLVEQAGKSKMFDTGRQLITWDPAVRTPHQFHLMAFYSDCYRTMEPVTEGWRIELMFNVVWKSPMTVATVPLPLSSLLAVLNKVTECLKGWQSPAVDFPAPKMLLFLLEDNYARPELGFSDLTGQDRLLAQILHCSHLVDVHLAVLTQQQSANGRAHQMDHWINANDTLISLKDVDVDVKSQLVISSISEEPTWSQRHPVLVIVSYCGWIDFFC